MCRDVPPRAQEDTSPSGETYAQYNPDGDKLMSSVILNATFDNTENLA